MIDAIVSSGESLRITVAATLWTRVRGLLGRPAPAARAGMLITRCRSVHTIGMRYAIDVVFLDESWRVVDVVPDVQPWRWRVAPPRRVATVHTLEMAAGQASTCHIGFGTHLYPSLSPSPAGSVARVWLPVRHRPSPM